MPSCSIDDSVCTHTTVLRNSSIQRPAAQGGPILLDTVLYPNEYEIDQHKSPPDSWAGRGVGAAICYAGVSGFYHDVVLENHLVAIVQPLVWLFPAAVSVAFSTSASKVSQSLVERFKSLGVVQAIQQKRPAPRGGPDVFKNANLQFSGIEHCGTLILQLEAQRASPFGFAIRMRYDIIFEPHLALSRWPIWHTNTSAPMFGLSKYVKGLAMDWASCPGVLAARRCIAQDVFLVWRNCAAMRSAHALFTANHSNYRVFRTLPLHTVKDLPEANLFGAALAEGIPMDVAWHPHRCLWMIAPWRTLFAGRCELLRNMTNWQHLQTHSPAAMTAARLARARMNDTASASRNTSSRAALRNNVSRY